MSSLTMAPARPLRIVLPGGSGQIGQVLARYFQQRGHYVTVLTRSPFAATWETVHWDGETPGPWIEHLEGADICINLAGHGPNFRLTARNRRALTAASVHTTQLLGSVMAALTSPPRLWMNASSVAVYGRSSGLAPNQAIDESGPTDFDALTAARNHSLSSQQFSARLAHDSEAALYGALLPNTRKVALRSATVLSPAPGGAFAAFSRLVHLSLGGFQGGGRQFVSWIHADDFARAVEFLIGHEEIEGPINLATPNPLPNREFMAALREAWGIPNGLPTPALLVRLTAFLLRTSPDLFLASRCMVPGRLLEAGFAFEFPDWPEAAFDLVRQWRQRD